jgi:hypothetical protein
MAYDAYGAYRQRFPAAVMDTGIRHRRTNPKPTIEQERQAEEDPIFAERLYGNVAAAQKARGQGLEQRAAAATANVVPTPTAMTRGEAESEARKRAAPISALAQQSQGAAANASRMAQRATEARTAGVAPSALVALQMKRQQDEAALAGQVAQTNLTNQQANVAIPAQAALAHGQAFGQRVEPFAALAGAGIKAFGDYMTNTATSAGRRYEADKRLEGDKYVADKSVEQAQAMAAARPVPRQYLDPSTQAQIQGIDTQMEALKPYLYGKDEMGGMKRNEDAWTQWNDLTSKRNALMVPPSAMGLEAGQVEQGVSDEDLEFTAKKHGITVEEVKRRLGMG